jgi:hypothetical protein
MGCGNVVFSSRELPLLGIGSQRHPLVNLAGTPAQVNTVRPTKKRRRWFCASAIRRDCATWPPAKSYSLYCGACVVQIVNVTFRRIREYWAESNSFVSPFGGFRDGGFEELLAVLTPSPGAAGSALPPSQRGATHSLVGRAVEGAFTTRQRTLHQAVCTLHSVAAKRGGGWATRKYSSTTSPPARRALAGRETRPRTKRFFSPRGVFVFLVRQEKPTPRPPLFQPCASSFTSRAASAATRWAPSSGR